MGAPKGAPVIQPSTISSTALMYAQSPEARKSTAPENLLVLNMGDVIVLFPEFRTMLFDKLFNRHRRTTANLLDIVIHPTKNPILVVDSDLF